MPWVEIGPCGGDGKSYEKEWGTLTRQLGFLYLRFICGAPPKGCKLGLRFFVINDTKQHEVALYWNRSIRKGLPRAYIAKCQNALAIFDENIPWHQLRKDCVNPRIRNIALSAKKIALKK